MLLAVLGYQAKSIQRSGSTPQIELASTDTNSLKGNIAPPLNGKGIYHK